MSRALGPHDNYSYVTRRRTIRLAAAIYREPGSIFSITIATAPRQPVFADIGFGKDCVTELRSVCQERDVRCFADCLMPDHVHLLLGLGTQADLISFVGAWKSKCFRIRHRHSSKARFWQRSFFDHALRREDDLIVVARYIFANPVRAGLAEDPREYLLSGSFEFEIDDLWV